MKKKTIHKNKISKECWNLDYSFLCWLKERLPVYLKEAGKVVDLTYHKFKIGNKEYNQKEVIEFMISDVNFLISHDWYDEGYTEVQNHLLECWSKVISAMWW